jgi:hypothetical protein
MKTELNKVRDNVNDLYGLEEYAYERIFKMYKDQDQFFAYNILKSISVPADIATEAFSYYRVAGKVSWTQLSFFHYDTISLWWLICIMSGIRNPVKLPEPGTVLKILKPSFVRGVLDTLSNEIHKK